MYIKSNKKIFKKITLTFFAAWFSLVIPTVSVAAEVTPSPTPTNAIGQTTGAPSCTGAGCGQGENQGFDQGTNQGGPTLKDLGAVENEEGKLVLPEGVKDTRQGAGQGTLNGSNTNTGSDSDNKVDVNSGSNTNNKVNNNSTDGTVGTASGNTGGNDGSQNTGTSKTSTGDAGIGVTQVKNNNTTSVGGSSGLNVNGYKGTKIGDLDLDFGSQSSDLSKNGSVKATNDTTGSDSENEVNIKTKVEENNEIQNDGEINNKLDLEAITGQNKSNENTGDGDIKTGNANISATLINLLNTTVINGSLWVTVADIFGDLVGNIKLPSLSELASKLGISQKTLVEAINEDTGSDSINNINVALSDKENTNITNDADVKTNVNASAITGQNEANENTSGGNIKTGQGDVSASNVTIANTTVEGGNWGLVVVNSFNRWLGFLIGDNGETIALSQDETIRRIEAQNSQTGSGSTNEIDIDMESERNTDVVNKANINNEINASAITGQNEANRNTGQGNIETGDANIQATAVNLANTTVKDASLFIAVVNIMGNWWGDMYYGDKALSGIGGSTVALSGNNSHTGANSENNINVDIDKEKNTNINNKANVNTNLNANIDTGNNIANRNTLGGEIETGGGKAKLNSQTAANLTGIVSSEGLAVEVAGGNDVTGFNSNNTLTVNINDTKTFVIDNDAEVNTVFGGGINTGNNEASHNTVGGNIKTGYADATLSIDNLINQVWLAMVGGGLTVDADLSNYLTGAESDNVNTVDVSKLTLIDIINKGLVNNIIDFLLNTGGNVASYNTVGGNISTGDGCISGHLVNDVNSYYPIGVGGNGLYLDNDAEVNNDVKVGVETGNNDSIKNTYAEKEEAKMPCPVKAKPVDVEPSPTPMPGIGGDKPDEENGVVPGIKKEEEEDEKKFPRVLAAVDKPKPPGVAGIIFRRFPVAGGEDVARWVQGQSREPWLIFLIMSLPILAAAYYLDRQKQLASLT